ncbi:MAG TPA: hypothetical protein VIY08_09555 [Candidatus Nitrosocosmicus sp.]
MEDDHSRKFWAARPENETDDNVVDTASKEEKAVFKKEHKNYSRKSQKDSQ